MDIFEWVFKKRPKQRHIPAINLLKRSIKPEIRLYHNLWTAHSEKRAYLRRIQQGRLALLFKARLKTPEVKEGILRKLVNFNNEILFY